MNTKRIIVACGTGIATSTVVATKIEEAAKANGISVDIRQCKVTELDSMAGDADLIVTTTITQKKYPVPVINGLAFITGIGADKVLDEIIQKLKG
ncbi:PTS sugar transporter subunit IIB [Calorimonas adulescens]|jgi:PTS system, Lactose/Cellobiose specific IIB subunit.|uniref:PTS sugar transporter subunit IIB n=1 Tax=Calorimonas adulescens TaxID=2606906 RepID=A0A5D8QA63_9THEO|nr:PTS sugar transporter subunit IIB [Calorimonas adulescens]TZE81490.1 PTS sugar transporter subunit IIB [Calorimonas adulescens]